MAREETREELEANALFWEKFHAGWPYLISKPSHIS